MSIKGEIKVVRNYSAPDVKKELYKRGVYHADMVSAAIKAEAICRSVGLQEYLLNGRKYTVDMGDAMKWHDENKESFHELISHMIWLVNPKNESRVPVSVIVPLFVHLDEYADAVGAFEKFSEWFRMVTDGNCREGYTSSAQTKLLRTLRRLNSSGCNISYHKLASVLYNAWAFDCLMPISTRLSGIEPSDEYLFTDFDFTEVM